MSGFTLVWSKLLDSSVWMEDQPTRLVWITMLLMKDWEGKVTASPKALAHRARVEPDQCARALEILLSPDPESTSQEFDGRRIEVVPGGWKILNHEKYRHSSDEAKRKAWREQKERQRKRRYGPQARERLAKRDGNT